MTPRAIGLGFLSVILLGISVYFNDVIITQTFLIGNYLPVAVYAILIILLLGINPILGRINPAIRLNGRELALIVAMLFVSCAIPSSGLLRTFTAVLVMPHHHIKSEPGWSEQGLLESTPAQMLADPAKDDAVVGGMLQGLGTAKGRIGLSDIPWSALSQSMLFWLPLVIALFIGLLGLALMLHRQWADHEQLPYPIAVFTNSLLPVAGKSGEQSGVFQSRMFWIALGLVTFYHLCNYLNAWVPETIAIPRTFDFRPLFSGWPDFRSAAGTSLNVALFFSVIGFAYFLSSEMSLSLGLAPFFFVVVLVFFKGLGISITAGGDLAPADMGRFGAYLGLFLVLLYTGRHYYSAVARRAVGLQSKENVEMESVWGFRVYLLAAVFFCVQCIAVGLDWQLVLILLALITLLFVVLSRVVAETGIFFIQAGWYPGAAMLGLLGAQALGIEALIIIALVSVVFTIDPREALMPFAMNAFKLLDLRGLKLGRPVLLCAAALLLMLLVALPVTLFWQYDSGVMRDAWAWNAVPKKVFTEAVTSRERLLAQSALEQAEAIKGWARFGAISPTTHALPAALTGLGLVLVFTVCRMRFLWWPIHPILFLFAGTYPARLFAGSLLAGWFVKTAVVRFGGEKTYHKYKPFMIGLIAGEVCAVCVTIVIGTIYYFVTGDPPKPDPTGGAILPR